MLRLLTAFVCCQMLFLSSAHAQPPAPPTGSTDILEPGAQLETLWDDGNFTEGPAVAPGGAIYFSDIGAGTAGRIMKFDPRTKNTTVFSDPSGQSNGLMFDRDGRLIACCGADGGRRALCLVHEDGTLSELVAEFEGKRLNAPNDLVISPQGRIYFSDPRYGGPEPRELDHQSVYLFDPASQRLARVTTDITKPNGVILSPDSRRLYIAETDNETGNMTLNLFPVGDNGALGARQRLVDYGDQMGVDGMTVDVEGRVYAAVRSQLRPGIVVYTPHGEELAYIPTGVLPTNCCFGRAAGEGDEHEARTLYVTAGKGLYRILLKPTGYHPAAAN